MHNEASLKKLAYEAASIPNYPNISPKTCHLDTFLLAGEGEFGLNALKALQALSGKTIVAYVSDDPKINSSQLGCPVLPLNVVAKEYPRLPVICASKNNFYLAQQLLAYFSQVYLYRQALPDLIKNVEFLADDLSKELLISHCEMIHNNVYVNNFSEQGGTQYEHEKVAIAEHEHILCIGPYLGNPLKAFAERSNNKFIAHCLEANPYVYAQLCRNIVLWNMKDKVIPVCAGAWSETGMVSFAGESHTGGGNIELESQAMTPLSLDLAIYAYSVDDYLKMTGFTPSLIESGRIGIAEHVVAGASEYIKVNKPKLILLDYPQSNTPALLKALVPEYKIYYSECHRINYGTFFATI